MNMMKTKTVLLIIFITISFFLTSLLATQVAVMRMRQNRLLFQVNRLEHQMEIWEMKCGQYYCSDNQKGDKQ